LGKYYDDQTKIQKNENPRFIVEKPIAYITDNDNLDIYGDKIATVPSTKKKVYSSIHYTVRYDKYYFEIQVRTLFEEGWLEFDHRVRYPYDSDNQDKKSFLNVLTGLATTADNLISFYDRLDFTQSTVSAPSDSDESNKSQAIGNTEGKISIDNKKTKKPLQNFCSNYKLGVYS